ncbi:50S ribosomal protein L21 [Patescibacteria group bacterium]
MKYAIIKIQGSQHKVSEGDEILVDKLSTDKPEAKVLMIVDKGKIKLGKPEVGGAKITLKLLKPLEKGKKLTVSKFKAKSRYRRKIGFRPKYSRLLVQKIS